MRKFGALLEAGAAFPDQIGLTDPNPPQRLADGGESPLADTEDSDIRRLDQRYLYAIARLRAQCSGKITRGNPTGSTASNNQNALGHGTGQ
jgi:hypothetical protein